MPRLSDDAVVQIHDFIGHFLDLFEARYGDQIHRYYEDRAAHNIVGPDTDPRHRRPAVLNPSPLNAQRRQPHRCRRSCSRIRGGIRHQQP